MINRKRVTVIVFLLVGFVGIVFTGFWARGVLMKAQQVFAQAEAVRDLQAGGISLDSIPDTINLAGDISLSIDELKTEVAPILPVIRLLKRVPGIGPYLGNLEPMLDFTSNLTKAVVVLGRTSLPFLEGEVFETGQSMPQAFSEFLLVNQTNFSVAEKFYKSAEEARRQIDSEYIPEQFRGELSSIDQYMTLSSSLFDGLKIMPFLLGTEEQTTYLILVQNRDEIRPTGGFITAFGIFQIRAGRIFVLKIDDSILFDYVSDIREPPEPIKELMLANYLVPRDANWSPDFPTAAALTQEIYLSSTGIKTNGVIAFDQQFIVDLLAFTGPVTLSDEEQIDTENVEDKIIAFKQAAVEVHNLEERKDLLSILAPHIIKKIFKKDQVSDLVELGKILIKEIEEGHLSIFLNDPDGQDFLVNWELDSAVRPGEGDFFMLVDSNVGFGKIDQFIERSLTYSVNLEDPTNPEGKIITHYQHTKAGEETCFQGSTQNYDLKYRDYFFPRCYWNYWRVLMAEGTQVEAVDFPRVPSEYFHEGVEWDQEPDLSVGEGGTSLAGGLIVVPQLSEQEVHIETVLPATILQKNDDGGLVYTLRIQKQAGLNYLPVEIIVTPPQGYSIDNVPANWIFDVDENMVIWKGEIDRTTDFSLEFSLGQ